MDEGRGGGRSTSWDSNAVMLHVKLILLINIIAYSICCTEFMEIENWNFKNDLAI